MKQRHAKSGALGPVRARLEVDGVLVLDYRGRLGTGAFIRNVKRADPTEHVSWAGLVDGRRR